MKREDLRVSLFDPRDAHFWIALALIVFLAGLWRAKVPGMVAKALDDAGARVQAQLDEAARLRHEAQTLLDQIRLQHQATEAAAAEMMKTAQADAERLRAEAQIALEVDLRRRRALAERRIATAETQAASYVRSAAADLAADISEAILAARILGAESDPLVDAGIRTMAARLS
jgi:F-type H+-transporting ATPase subunit b